ncbi:efflux RND transporter periplasmic adaptor subunit [Campylobacter showae]|jgi:efflux transporter, RND family, MFP subunit|uniref:efflux RND transporter periplasmic adaptor subunit n=1 Tax=Campylobacter showae TaxID=204 RepID=UPI000F0823BC|nr:efflux RND transporter periplasmic adaptor subunit [Campylobacter showae]
MKLGNFLKAYFLSFALIFVAAAQENKSTQEAASQAEKNTAEQQTAQAGVKDDTDASEQSVRQDKQNPDARQNQNDEAIKLTVVSPKIAKFSPKLNLHGELVAKDDVAVGSALQGQQISEVLVEVGENVQKGQILALLDNAGVKAKFDQQTAALEVAKQNLNSAKAAFSESESALKRAKDLAAKKAISSQELEQANAKEASARANLNSAKAQISQIDAQITEAKDQLGKASVIAPVSGVVTAKKAQIGALTSGEALFNIAKDGVIELSADTDARELAQIKVGMSAQAQIYGVKEAVKGKVRLVPVSMDTSSRLGKVKISLDGEAKFIGSYAKVVIDLPEFSALALPAQAVSFTEKGAFTTIVKGGKAVKRKIQTGLRANGLVQVISGVSKDDEVALKAAALVNDGEAAQRSAE